MERFFEKDKVWKHVDNQYRFFDGKAISSIICEQEWFRGMIELSAKLNPNCSSLSTFIARMGEVIIYENYIRNGIKFEADAYRNWGSRYSRDVLHRPLEFYSKNTQVFFKKYDIKVTRNVEHCFERDYAFYEKVFAEISNTELEDEDKRELIVTITGSRSEIFRELINDFRYDVKALAKYLCGYLAPFENLNPDEAIYILRDYYRMANQIGREVKKYPKYLKSMHDIITSNYSAYKKEYDELLFSKVMKPELEFEGKEYTVLNPKSTKDIVREGTDLNHCVGSYADRIIAGNTYIFFLRLTKTKESSLVTLELKDKAIVQAKGAYNRPMSEEERKFIEKYCKEKELKLLT